MSGEPTLSFLVRQLERQEQELKLHRAILVKFTVDVVALLQGLDKKLSEKEASNGQAAQQPAVTIAKPKKTKRR